jgi:hypothetical protein
MLLAIPLILLSIISSAWWVMHGNLSFHTDIARDFLLIEDILVNKNLTLLGPRSGAIPGVFHGPLWLYLNLPAFAIGKGNPVVVGYFWVILSIITLLVIYFVAKKIFDKKVAVLSFVLFAAVQSLDIKNLFNPYGALMLFPIFFYLFKKYLEKSQVKYLILVFFTLGLIIQFQMAFGGPILLITLILSSIVIIQTHKYKHILSTLAIIPPLFSYILFELRNKFLQTYSVYNYLFGTETHGKVNLALKELLSLRVKESLIDFPEMLTNQSSWINLGFLVIFIYLFFKTGKKKEKFLTNPYFLFGIFYFGFWVISLAFAGPIWSYYYWPFLPLFTILFSSCVKHIHKYLFYFIYILVLIPNLTKTIKQISSYNYNPQMQEESTWAFNRAVAKNIFKEAKGDFGYFIFTPDLYGYYPRYAMNYTQREFSDIKVFPFAKKETTFLLIAPPPAYGKDPNSIWAQKNQNSENWKKSDLKIEKEPMKTTEYKNGFKVEEYSLNDKEVKIPANPFLIQDLTFR